MDDVAGSGKRLLTSIVGMALVCLTLAGPAQAISEQEPNNTKVEPNGPVLGGETWTGALGDFEDDDWLKFYVTKQTTVTIDISRSVVLGPHGYFEISTHDANDVIDFVSLDEGISSGQLSATVGPGKYLIWIVSSIQGDTDGMSWQLDVQGDLATWEQVEAACVAGKARLATLNKAVVNAKKALNKAKKRKKGRKAAVKKAKAGLAKAQKAVSTAKTSSAAVCAIEE